MHDLNLVRTEFQMSHAGEVLLPLDLALYFSKIICHDRKTLQARDKLYIKATLYEG